MKQVMYHENGKIAFSLEGSPGEIFVHNQLNGLLNDIYAGQVDRAEAEKRYDFLMRVQCLIEGVDE